MLSLIGIALYLGYVVPLSGFHWEYVMAIFGMTATAVISPSASNLGRKAKPSSMSDLSATYASQLLRGAPLSVAPHAAWS